jgi:hypothetical protein
MKISNAIKELGIEKALDYLYKNSKKYRNSV